MIISTTGHRPNKLGGYSDDTHVKLVKLAEFFISRIDDKDNTVFFTGMAQGWDQAVAAACINQKVSFIAYIPFKGQESSWPPVAQKTYQSLIFQATKVLIADTEIDLTKASKWDIAKAMQARNELMVSNSAHVLALWDGTKGGTANTVKYANKMKIPVTNIWETFKAME